HAPKPGLEGAPRVEAAELSVETEKHLLDQVLGLVSVPDVAVCEPVEAALEPVDELLESLSVALGRPRCQCFSARVQRGFRPGAQPEARRKLLPLGLQASFPQTLS